MLVAVVRVLLYFFFFFFFFFNDTATTEIYTLSLHDALPVSSLPHSATRRALRARASPHRPRSSAAGTDAQNAGIAPASGVASSPSSLNALLMINRSAPPPAGTSRRGRGGCRGPARARSRDARTRA